MSTTARGQVHRWTPTPEQEAYLQATEATSRFLHNLPDHIRARYAGQWIAAKGNEVVAAAPTRAELEDRLGESCDPAVLVLRLERGNTIRCRDWFRIEFDKSQLLTKFELIVPAG